MQYIISNHAKAYLPPTYFNGIGGQWRWKTAPPPSETPVYKGDLGAKGGGGGKTQVQKVKNR